MRIEKPDFALDLPAGFVVTSSATDPSLTAMRETDSLELYANGGISAEPGGTDAAIRHLVEAHQSALRREDPTQRVSALETTERRDASIARYTAFGETPFATLHACVLRNDLVLGRHPIATLSLYQHSFGPRVKDSDTFRRIFELVLATFVVCPLAPPGERAAAGDDAPRLDRVYPYLVPPGYLAGRAAGAPAPRVIGHDLYLSFAEDQDGVARVLWAEDRPELGDPRVLLARAQSNLERAVRAREIPVCTFDGPRGWPILVFGPEWRAASGLLLPGLAALASTRLSAERTCASVPHRDVMIVFREGDAKYRDEIRTFVAEKESDGRKPLTRGLFRVSDAGPSALVESRAPMAVQAVTSTPCAAAVEANERGREAAHDDRYADAVPHYLEAVRLEPSWCLPWFNLGMAYKHTGDFVGSLRASERALDIDAGAAGKGAIWNLGIAATALGDWKKARWAWRAFGLKLPEGEGPIEGLREPTPMRINPRGGAEVVWSLRIDPARARLRSVPLPASKHRYDDLILHDGAPSGYRKLEGRDVPVFDELALLEVSGYETWEATVTADDEGAILDLHQRLAALGVPTEDWTASVRMLCEKCSKGTPHEHGDDEVVAWKRDRTLGLAVLRSDPAAALRAWASAASGRTLGSLRRVL
jgi:hypothetical protein